MASGVAVVLAMILSASQATGTDTSSFCERMAAKLDMKATERGRPKRPTGEWRVSLFSTTQRLFTGGSSMVSFAMRPIGDAAKATAADYLRLQSTCQQHGKEMLCRVVEPMVLVISTDRAKAEMESLPGERAEVGTSGSHVFCRDPRAFTTD